MIYVTSGKKPALFYTDTLRGFRAQGCASDRHKAPSIKPRRGAPGRLAINRRAVRSRKRSTRGRVKMGLACPEVCAEPHVEDEEKFPGSCSLGLRGAPCKEWETFHGSQFSRSARSSCKAGEKPSEVRGILAGAERV